ncbi:hypothetical protein CFOL_v3_13081 [Cephalotus follicularis]|uniref:DUF7812 domain-containing protein n=1 Tax=Cephalotus follicularis TaxID=3775 RepID=A0A1Q3BNI2_CEPFO|nr:hypothetical protein CFOL_v3_13081 [Cephalotus follicularis]
MKKTCSCSDSSPPIFQFHNLIASIRSPEGLKSPIMKKMYLMLVHLSSSDPESWFKGEVNSDYLDIEFNQHGFHLKFGELFHLFDILFQQLDEMFNQFFSALACGEDNWPFLGELTLLLRCCMVCLCLLVLDQNLLIEKARVLFMAISRLISIDLTERNGTDSLSFKGAFSRKCSYVYDNCTTSIAEDFVASISFLEPSDQCCTFVCSLLEVVADEFLVHKSLREYFMLIDSLCPTIGMHFICHSGHGDIGCVLEVIFAHFSLSILDGRAFENFLNRLFWHHGEDSRVPEMSLPAAMSLLLNPIILSAPKMFQAYLFIFIAEVIGINMSSKNMQPDLSLLDCYLSAFERSVILYTRHMSSLHIDGNPMGGNGSSIKSSMLGSSCQLTFESYLRPATRDKICDLVNKSNKLCNMYISNTSSRTKSDLVVASISYTKESLNMFDQSCKDEILSILRCLISKGSSDDVGDTLLLPKDDTSLQDICLLASILKLMSCSILQAMLCIRCSGNLDSRITPCDPSSCKEYEVLIGMANCFKQFDVRLPIQKFLFDTMETHPMRHKDSKYMLLHFSGLLSLSYNHGIDFLVKNCIFTVITLLNLFLIKEGDLDVMGPLLGAGSLSFLSKDSEKIGEALVNRKSSKTIASKFQKIQTLYTRMDSSTSVPKRLQHEYSSALESATVPNHVDCAVEIEEEIEESSSGEIFLHCVGAQRSDFDDLADFIKCKPGRDYSDYLKGRQTYRKWKHEKVAVLRWKKKKNTWKYPKGLKARSYL